MLVWAFLVCVRVPIGVSQNLKTACTFVSDTNATRSARSPWLDLTLSASGGHTLMCEHRPPPPGPERQMKLSAWTRPQRHVSQLLLYRV